MIYYNFLTMVKHMINLVIMNNNQLHYKCKHLEA